MDELIEKCDIVSLHVAYVPETEQLLSAQRIAKLKPGSVVLNTSRGGIIDTAALARALKEERIYAGLDVYANEPGTGKGEFNDVLRGVPNWVGTHHIGASTAQAQKSTANEAVHIIERYVETGDAENCVNFARQTPAVCELMVRHYDKIGVLTRTLNDLRESEINVHEVHNVIFEGAKAAVAWIQLDVYPPQELLDKISRRRDEIIQLRVLGLQSKT